MTITTIPAPLLGKVAIITGGSRDIGEATAIDFAKRGCSHIAITYLSDTTAAESVLSQLRNINPDIKVAAFKADVRDRGFGRYVIQESRKVLETDHVDILVSNAGLQDIRDHVPADRTTYEEFEKLMTSQTWAPMSLALECVTYMPPGGRIIMNSSGSSKMALGDPLLCTCASKAAMDATARNLAVIYGPTKGITVNSIGTGATDTDTLRKIMEVHGERFEQYAAQGNTLKRLGTAKEIASIISFVASPEASWINGNQVPANGGAMLELQG